jgi:hypothetical protein
MKSCAYLVSNTVAIPGQLTGIATLIKETSGESLSAIGTILHPKNNDLVQGCLARGTVGQLVLWGPRNYSLIPQNTC